MKNVITQKQLVKEISKSEDINMATVRTVLSSAERIITSYLSSTSSTDSYMIKLFSGLNIESTHLPIRNINRGLFQNYQCKDRIKINCTITKYYEQKVNELHT